jgi:PIN domain nuclease of toxin-antitoxin system
VTRVELLLDTHALLWWLVGNPRLSRVAADAMRSGEAVVHVSAASAWEIATKHRLGKLPEADAIAADLPGCVADQGFEPLPISFAEAELAGRLAGDHRDPFDRMLIAQALLRDLTLVSGDAAFDAFGVRRLW